MGGMPLKRLQIYLRRYLLFWSEKESWGHKGIYTFYFHTNNIHSSIANDLLSILLGISINELEKK